MWTIWSGSSHPRAGTSIWRVPSSPCLSNAQALAVTCRNASLRRYATVRSMWPWATSIFPCQTMDFPIRYLGIPLGVSKLPKIAWQLLLDRVGDQLPTWRGRLLCRPGHLTSIKMTMTMIPIHTCIAVGIPPWLLRAIRKLMTSFLWTSTDMVQAEKCLVAWKRVQRPLQLGGLGVMELDLLGIALRTRWLWL
jgi:hypothetical protein